MSIRDLDEQEQVSALENIGDMDPVGVFDEYGELLAVAWGTRARDKLDEVARLVADK